MDKLLLGSDHVRLVDKDVSRCRLLFSFWRITLLTVSMPFFSFLFCIVWSLVYNFEKATETHCKVYNFLPSVSAAIGHFKPQKNIWKVAITMQAIVRTMVLYVYHLYYKENVYRWAQGIINFALLSYLLENISLVLLSFWSSDESYVLHKISFTTFLLMSFLHMFLSYIIVRHCCNIPKDTNYNISLKWKFISMISNAIAILLASYFFYRHNKYCEPFVYSIFALSEYMVVLTNMIFHITTAYDFAGKSLLLSSHGVKII